MKSEIISGVWISSKEKLEDYKFIINKKIKYIINCTTINIDNYISIIHEKYNIKILYLNIPIDDNINNIKKNNVLLLDNMNDIINIIYKNINNNILIVCNTGYNAALTIISCYLIKYGKIDYNFVSKALISRNKLLDNSNNLYSYCIKQYYIELKKI